MTHPNTASAEGKSFDRALLLGSAADTSASLKDTAMDQALKGYAALAQLALDVTRHNSVQRAAH